MRDLFVCLMCILATARYIEESIEHVECLLFGSRALGCLGLGHYNIFGRKTEEKFLYRAVKTFCYATKLSP